MLRFSEFFAPLKVVLANVEVKPTLLSTVINKFAWFERVKQERNQCTFGPVDLTIIRQYLSDCRYHEYHELNMMSQTRC